MACSLTATSVRARHAHADRRDSPPERRVRPVAAPVVQIGVDDEKARQRRAWYAQPLDQRAVYRVASWIIKTCLWSPRRWLAGKVDKIFDVYPKARSFVVAHSMGTVTSWEHDARRKVCSECILKYTHPNGLAFCGADRCGCGPRPVACLESKTGLEAWKCPKDRFDYGALVRWMRRVIRR